MPKSLPNIYIIGAPKCGTTSLANWLSQHPCIYVPAVKEPNFLNKDHKMKNAYSEAEYRALFSNRTERYAIDASVLYCVSHDALNQISRDNSTKLVILCVREPLDCFLSLHAQQQLTLYETHSDPTVAWNKHKTKVENARKKGDIETAINLDYRKLTAMGDICEQVSSIISDDKLLIVNFDELTSNSNLTISKIENMLCIPPFTDYTLEHKNSRKELRYPAFHKFVKVLSTVKHRLGLRRSLGFAKYTSRLVQPVQKNRNIDDINIPQEAIEHFRRQSIKLREYMK